MTIDEAMAGMTVSQVMRLRCAINLHKLAADLVAISEWKVGENDNDRRQKRIDRAKHLVMRKAPECLQTFWLILKNGKNRKESIWQLSQKTPSK